MAHPAKSCGGCTLCCKIMAVPELSKADHQWCGHCNIGVECRIYPERPNSCRNFECSWLKVAPSVLDDSFRPDRVKVVLCDLENGAVAHCDPKTPHAWRHPKVIEMLRRLDRAGGMALARAGTRFWVIKADREWEVPPELIRHHGNRTDVLTPRENRHVQQL